MDMELLGWIIMLVIGLLFVFVVFPLWRAYQEDSEIKRMFPEYEEYHDDMEDVWG